MGIKNPIRSLKDNLLLTGNNDIWAYYQVSPKTISQNNPKAIQENKEQMANLMQLLAPYEDVELIMFPRTNPVDSRNCLKVLIKIILSLASITSKKQSIYWNEKARFIVLLFCWE